MIKYKEYTFKHNLVSFIKNNKGKIKVEEIYKRDGKYCVEYIEVLA